MLQYSVVPPSVKSVTVVSIPECDMTVVVIVNWEDYNFNVVSYAFAAWFCFHVFNINCISYKIVTIFTLNSDQLNFNTDYIVYLMMTFS